MRKYLLLLALFAGSVQAVTPTEDIARVMKVEAYFYCSLAAQKAASNVSEPYSSVLMKRSDNYYQIGSKLDSSYWDYLVKDHSTEMEHLDPSQMFAAAKFCLDYLE